MADRDSSFLLNDARARIEVLRERVPLRQIFTLAEPEDSRFRAVRKVQIDNFVWACPPDAAGPDFFLYDLSWVGFCRGAVDAPAIYAAVGIAVEGIDSLRRAIEALFAQHGPLAIAVKSQHAYERTLLWEERTDADAERGGDLPADGGVEVDRTHRRLGAEEAAGEPVLVVDRTPREDERGAHPRREPREQ